MLKSLLKGFLNQTGYRIIKQDFFEDHYRRNGDPAFRRSGDLRPLEQLFYRYINDDFFFVQIGANDGMRYDPIHGLITKAKEKVAGICIEPVDEYFKELQNTYKDFPAIKLMRAAIHNTRTEALIYKMSNGVIDVEERLKGMASFDKTNFTKDGIPESMIVTEQVPCLSFSELIAQENVKKLHLLQIDAEGYDLQIIRSIDFESIKPRVINFEHRWEYGLQPQEEIFSVFKVLVDSGYQIVLNGNDALAYLL